MNDSSKLFVFLLWRFEKENLTKGVKSFLKINGYQSSQGNLYNFV